LHCKIWLLLLVIHLQLKINSVLYTYITSSWREALGMYKTVPLPALIRHFTAICYCDCKK